MMAPMSLLRLSIARYKWGRIWVVSRTYARPLYGKRGIIAGATSATYEIKLHMYRTVGRQKEVHPHIDILINVDDIVQDYEEEGDVSDTEVARVDVAAH